MKIRNDGWHDAEKRVIDVDPASIHPLTDEEKVEGLVRTGHPREEAERLVKEGKWGETVEKDYQNMVVDPVGWMHEQEARSYFFMTGANQMEDMGVELPDPDPGEDFSRIPEVYKPKKA